MAHPDFEELLAEFNDEHVKYLIGGAHAVALHARPRASKDIDIFIEPTRANAKRTVSALTHFFGGTAPQYITVDALLNPDTILQLGVAPVRVNLSSHLATVPFHKAWKKKIVALLVGLEPTIWPSMIRSQKESSNNPQFRRSRRYQARPVQRSKAGQTISTTTFPDCPGYYKEKTSKEPAKRLLDRAGICDAPCSTSSTKMVRVRSAPNCDHESGPKKRVQGSRTAIRAGPVFEAS